MINAVTDRGQEVSLEGIWVARYNDKSIVLTADMGEQIHCLNEIVLQDNGVVLLKDKPTAIGIYDADDELGLSLRSWDLKEGVCQIERIPLYKNNYKAIIRSLKKTI